MEVMYVFPTPLDAECRLTHDTGGWSLTGVPALHPSGRPGQSFTIPANTPDGNGCALNISAPGKVPLQLRGILYLHPEPAVRVDDFTLSTAAYALPALQVVGRYLQVPD